MDKSTYAKIIQSVCARIGMEKPTSTIIRNVMAHCRKLDMKHLRVMHPDANDFLLVVVRSYMDSIRQEPEFDFGEYLQNTRSATAKDVSPMWLQDNMPMDASKSMSVYFDTRLRRIDFVDNTPITNFGFAIVPKNTHTSAGNGNVHVRVSPSQITYFKVGTMLVPYTAAMRTANFTKELTLSFTALSANGILAEDQTYHFVFKYTVVSDYLVELTPIDRYCKFCPPIRHLDDVSWRFNDPIVPIAFNTDRMLAASLNYLSTDGRITFPYAHGLATGDVVIVQGLSTLDDPSNVVILNQVHSARGMPITVINPTIIAIGVDLTTIVSPDITSKPMVLFYSKTFRFPLEIGYQDIEELE